MKPQTQSLVKAFERRLRKARREVWRTVARTDEELATLEGHQAGPRLEDAGTRSVAAVLSRLDGAQRHLLDEIYAAQARLAAGTFGTCQQCARSIPLPRLPAGAAAVPRLRARCRARPVGLSRVREGLRGAQAGGRKREPYSRARRTMQRARSPRCTSTRTSVEGRSACAIAWRSVMLPTDRSRATRAREIA